MICFFCFFVFEGLRTFILDGLVCLQPVLHTESGSSFYLQEAHGPIPTTSGSLCGFSDAIIRQSIVHRYQCGEKIK
jgi:hypothetical protein